MFTETYLPIIVSALLSVLISGILGYLIKRSMEGYFSKKDAIEAERTKSMEELRKYHEAEDRAARIQDYKTVATEVMTPMIEKVNQISDKVDKLEDQMNNVSESTILNMRVDMKNLRDRFRKQGFADVGDKAMWKELYNRYKDMGGNHFKEYVDQWKEEVENLPEEKPEAK